MHQNHEKWISPIEIGLVCGKSKRSASPWAYSALILLLEEGIIERGYFPRAKYRIKTSKPEPEPVISIKDHEEQLKFWRQKYNNAVADLKIIKEELDDVKSELLAERAKRYR